MQNRRCRHRGFARNWSNFEGRCTLYLGIAALAATPYEAREPSLNPACLELMRHEGRLTQSCPSDTWRSCRARLAAQCEVCSSWRSPTRRSLVGFPARPNVDLHRYRSRNWMGNRSKRHHPGVCLSSSPMRSGDNCRRCRGDASRGAGGGRTSSIACRPDRPLGRIAL